MLLETRLDALSPDPHAVVTVGTFDGVHVGHRAVIGYLLERARKRGGRSVVVTFDPHPREVVRREAVPLLTTVDERAEVMGALGVDRVVVVPFTEAFSRLSAEAFVEEVLVGRIGLQEIVVGYDHGFGRGREGDAELLTRLGARHHFSVDVMPPQVVEEHVVSSTEIRRQLEGEGDVRLAEQMLGRRYALAGRVVEGDRRGRTIGFPTANLTPVHPRKVLPREGVYAVYATVDDDRRPAMMNIGRRPTFAGDTLRLEVHLLDYEGDLYGRVLRVEFVDRLRDERRFESVEALREQLSRDRERCRDLFQRVH